MKKLNIVLEYKNASYILCCKNTQYSVEYLVYSYLHENDKYLTDNYKHPQLTIKALEEYSNVEPYYVGYLKVSLRGKSPEGHGDITKVTDLKDRVLEYTRTQYKTHEYVKNTYNFEYETFAYVLDVEVKNDNLSLSYVKTSSVLDAFSCEDTTTGFRATTVSMNTNVLWSNARGLKTQKLTDTDFTLCKSSIASVTMPILESVTDLSYYRTRNDDGTFTYHKDYKSVKNVDELNELLADMQKELNRCKEAGEEFVVGLDTETTGLNVYNLKKDYQSTVVSVPIAFKDDSAYVIFTDMLEFENVELNLVARVMEELFSRDAIGGNREVNLDIPGIYNFRCERDDIIVVGQNSSFDVRAFLTCGANVYFDNDCRQMSFNLDPFRTKRSNGLKFRAKKEFGYDQPSLSDLLGSGNEDKYKILNSEMVAIVYGCSDADLTRMWRNKLVNIMRDEEVIRYYRCNLYERYREQDVLLNNLYARGDYFGMRIDKDVFIENGNHVLNDITKMKDFLDTYVRDVLHKKNIAEQRKVLLDNEDIVNTHVPNPTMSLEEKVEYIISEMKVPDKEPVPLTGSNLAKILYSGGLGYPVLHWTKETMDVSTGIVKPAQPSVDKVARQKLLQHVNSTSSGALTEDIVGGRGNVLIDANKFNHYMYPAAYVLNELSGPTKEYDAYYKPFIEGSFDDYIFMSTSMANIDTRRTSNPLQTIKSGLKSNMLPHTDDHYMLVFDMSQVELRVMPALAHDLCMVYKSTNPESDSHTEVAGILNGKEPYEVTPKERKNSKSINFGYPYGLTIYSMCERLFGENTPKNIAMTQDILDIFIDRMWIVVQYLEHVRDNSLKEVGSFHEERYDLPENLRDYLDIPKGMPVGVVRNLYGFLKSFDLRSFDYKTKEVGADLTHSQSARIRRQVGNFPIQGTAAEIFRQLILKFNKACFDNGIADDVQWHVSVHDELVCSVRKGSIHPAKLIHLLYTQCTQRLTSPKTSEEKSLTYEQFCARYVSDMKLVPEEFVKKEWMADEWTHPPYYIGINLGYSWGDCKDDTAELPVILTERISEEWLSGKYDNDTDWGDEPEWARKHIRQYAIDRIYEVLNEQAKQMAQDGVYDISVINRDFTNYIVKSYVKTYNKPLWAASHKSKDYPDSAYIADWALKLNEQIGKDSITVVTETGHALRFDKGQDYSSLNPKGKPVKALIDGMFVDYQDLKEVDESARVEDVVIETEGFYTESDDLAPYIKPESERDEKDVTFESLQLKPRSYELMTVMFDRVILTMFSYKLAVSRMRDLIGDKILVEEGNQSLLRLYIKLNGRVKPTSYYVSQDNVSILYERMSE